MKTYGTFNETRTSKSSVTFFAVQAAISSFPGDSRRNELRTIIDKISSTADRILQSRYTMEGCALAALTIPFTEYCVWDYSLVSKVAKGEFASWIDGIQENVSSSKDGHLDSPFITSDTSYFVVTLAILSSHSSLRNWLEYIELSSFKKNFFARRSIEKIWERLAKSDLNILKNSINVLFSVTPNQEDRWYTGTQLRSDDWNYLKPVY